LTNQNKKLNTLTLCGLIIGPILGSGIILLPPLLYNNIGNYSLIIWTIISILGFIFALIFAKLANLYKGEAGVSLATKEALGKKFQLLTSFYLIFAVFFGPVAVLLVAASFLEEYFSNNIATIAFGVYIFTYLLLIKKIDFIGKLMLFITSLTTLIFLISSLLTLYNVESFNINIPNISSQEFGYSFLIVFWAIVGWEVIGNYSNDVRDDKTLLHSVIISVIIISLIYLLTASAIVFGNFGITNQQDFKLFFLLKPLFGDLSQIILNILAVILCVGALTLFVGGVARLIYSLNLNPYLSKKSKNDAPIGALNLLAIVHIIILLFVHNGMLTISDLVAYADGFFIANALIGLITASILFHDTFFKYSAIVLTVLFFIILLYSNIFIISIIVLLFAFTYFKKEVF
jgi:amino acid efflux transporter